MAGDYRRTCSVFLKLRIAENQGNSGYGLHRCKVGAWKSRCYAPAAGDARARSGAPRRSRNYGDGQQRREAWARSLPL